MKNSKPSEPENWNVDEVVRERYAEAAQSHQEELCCPIDYRKELLEFIPEEILKKDYGCGDPSQYVQEGDVVLDLGSGAGKICFMASKIVGPKGRVIGVDFNPVMLDLARKYQAEVGERIGWQNTEFKRGRIQDLKTDVESKDKVLIEDESVDVVISNCVLNLVGAEEKKDLFSEIFRVVNQGGRVAISDIVSNQEVPEALQNDPELWSGCISGAFEETAFLKAFETAGFSQVQLAKKEEKPWKVVEGIEFRSVTVIAAKGESSLPKFTLVEQSNSCSPSSGCC